MVGVPRSRGCRECRRKKKGYDLQRPCGHCFKQNVECAYDAKTYKFVPQGLGLKSLSRSSSSTAILTLADRNLARTLSNIQVVSEFWLRYTPQADARTVYVNGIAAIPWEETVRSIASSDEVASLAQQACAFVCIGRLQSRQDYVAHSRSLYGRALRETNLALQDPVRARSDALLASCKLLGLYEHWRLEGGRRPSTQGTDWQRHVDGLCRILALRGPNGIATSNALFQDARLGAAISAVTRKTPKIYFTEPNWDTNQTLRDDLIDILSDLPGAIQPLQSLGATDFCSWHEIARYSLLPDIEAAFNECIRLGIRLQAWEDKVLRLANEARATTSRADLPLANSIFTLCTNHGIAFFYLVMQLCAASLVLYGTCWLTHRKLVELLSTRSAVTSFPGVCLPNLPAWMDPRPYADSIADNAAHSFSAEAGLWGAQIATFPMGAALHYYAASGGHESDKIRRMKSLLRDSTAASMSSDFLRSIAADASTTRGDPSNIDEHRNMASEWYGSSKIHSIH